MFKLINTNSHENQPYNNNDLAVQSLKINVKNIR